MKRNILALIIAVFTVLLLIPFSVTSQNKLQQAGNQRTEENAGAVYGTVIDKKTRVPIEYANIVVLRIKDSTMINGTISDKKGRFRIEKLPYGQLYIRVNFIGYSAKKLRDIVLTVDRPEKNLGTIELATTSTNLASVEINSEKQAINPTLIKRLLMLTKTFFPQVELR